jgi:hypothetical protein
MVTILPAMPAWTLSIFMASVISSTDWPALTIIAYSDQYINDAALGIAVLTWFGFAVRLRFHA